jgi:hypothetical protein
MDEPCKRSESGRDRKCRSWDLPRKTSAYGGDRQQEDLRAAFMGKRDTKRETYMQKSDWAKCEFVAVESRIRILIELTIVHLTTTRTSQIQQALLGIPKLLLGSQSQSRWNATDVGASGPRYIDPVSSACMSYARQLIHRNPFSGDDEGDSDIEVGGATRSYICPLTIGPLKDAHTRQVPTILVHPYTFTLDG